MLFDTARMRKAFQKSFYFQLQVSLKQHIIVCCSSLNLIITSLLCSIIIYNFKISGFTKPSITNFHRYNYFIPCPLWSYRIKSCEIIYTRYFNQLLSLINIDYKIVSNLVECLHNLLMLYNSKNKLYEYDL